MLPLLCTLIYLYFILGFCPGFHPCSDSHSTSDSSLDSDSSFNTSFGVKLIAIKIINLSKWCLKQQVS